MSQLENIEAIEKRLWSAADTLRANSNYASNEYFMPVMGLVFLRHSYSRYLAVKDEIIASLPTRGGKTPELTKKDFSKKSAIFLQPKAKFDYLVGLKDSDDRAKAVIDAMESIEGDYETLRGVLPKKEYRELDNEILGQLLRALNPEELKKIDGDVFGRIYEYFLTQFADQKAHDGGEFFTPISLVSMIANVLEPKKGKVISKDVLLYKDEANIGRTTIVGYGFPHKKCCVNEHVFILRTKNNIQNWLYFFLSQDFIQQAVANLNSNSAQPGISQEKLSSLKIIFPEQKMVRLFDDVAERIVKQIFILSNQNQKLAQVLDLLLPRLMSGAIEV